MSKLSQLAPLALVALVTLALSFFFSVAYIWSIAGFAAWAFLGHAVTIDEELPGGWSNPDEDPSVWRSSVRELAVKGLVFLAIVVAALAFPALRNLGA